MQPRIRTIAVQCSFHTLQTETTTRSHWRTENGATFQELHPAHGAEDVPVLHVCKGHGHICKTLGYQAYQHEHNATQKTIHEFGDQC